MRATFLDSLEAFCSAGFRRNKYGAKRMNMISTGSFQTEANASTKQEELMKVLTAAWEKKNSKAARTGGVSLMALSLAACGGSSEDTTPFDQAHVDAEKALSYDAGYDAGTDEAVELVTGLTTSNNTLTAANAELTTANAELTTANAELTTTNANLTTANADLTTDIQTANATITTINDTAHATEQAAYNAGETAGAASRDDEVNTLTADLATANSDLATANTTITTIDNTAHASEQDAYDAGVASLQATVDAYNALVAQNALDAARTLDADGGAITLSTSGTIIVSGTTAGADTLNATVDAGGNATVIFDFSDAEDTVVLTSADLTGVTAIEVQDGTVDFTAVGSMDGIALTLGSGAVLTAAQATGLASIGAREGAASYDLTVNVAAGDDVDALTAALTAAGAGGNVTVAADDGVLSPAQSAALGAVATVENASGGAVVTTNAAPVIADAETTTIDASVGGTVALTAAASVTDAEGNYNGGSITISFTDAYVEESGITLAAGDFAISGTSIIADSAAIAGDDDAIIGTIAYNGATDLDSTGGTDTAYESATITFSSDLVTDAVVTALLADIRINDPEVEGSGAAGNATATVNVTVADASGATASFSRLTDVDGDMALSGLADDDAEVEIQNATAATIDGGNAAIDLNGAATSGMTIAFSSSVAGDTFAIENVSGAAVAGQARVVGDNVLYDTTDTIIGTQSGNGTASLTITLGTLAGNEAAQEAIIDNILQGVTATYDTATVGSRDVTTTITSADAWGEVVTNESTMTIIQNFADAEVNGAATTAGADAAGPLLWSTINTAIAADQVVELKGNTYISLDAAAPTTDLTQAVTDGLLIVPAGTVVRLQSDTGTAADLSGVTGLSALGTIIVGTTDEPMTEDLTLTAAQANGLSGVVDSAADTITVTDLDATMDADLSGFSVTNAGNLAATGTLAADDEFTGDAGSFTVQLAGAFNLTVSAAVADGASIETTDAASDIIVTGVDGSFEGDLGGLVSGGADVSITVASDTTLATAAQLDSVDLDLDIAADSTLTLSASQATAIEVADAGNTVEGDVSASTLGSVGGSIVVTVSDMDTVTDGVQLVSMDLTALTAGSNGPGGYAGTSTMVIDQDVTIVTAYEDATTAVSIAAGATATADATLLSGETFAGAGAVSLTDLDDADNIDLSNIATTGGNTIAVTDAATNTLHAASDLGNFGVTVGEGTTFVLTGAQASGLTITGADDTTGAGNGGTIIATSITTAAVNLTGVTAGGVGTGTDAAGSFTVEASGNLHADTDFGTATSVNISDGDANAAEAITLTATAAQVTGRAVVDAAIANGTATDTGALTVNDLAADTDLDAVSIDGALTINVADEASVNVASNTKFGSDSNWSAGSVAIALVDSTLTTTAAQISGISVTGQDGADDDDGNGDNTGAEVNESTLVIDGEIAGNTDISTNVATSVGVNFTNSTVATTKTLTATAAQVDGETIGGAGTVAISGMTADADLAGVTAETVNVTATADVDVSSNTSLGSVDAFTATAANVTVSEAQLESIVFGGNGTVTLAGTSGDDNFNAGDDTVDLIINGGSGDDVIVGGTGDDTINGGSDDDTITGGVGADTINGSVGADTIVVASGDTGITVAAADTINGFTTLIDQLNLSSMASFAEVDAAGAGDATAATSFALGAAGLDGTAADGFLAFNVGGSGNSYLFVDEDGDGTLNTGDTLIVLNGVVDSTFDASTDII